MHDVKNHLLVVRGSLELALEQAPDALLGELLLALSSLRQAIALLQSKEGEARAPLDLGELLRTSAPLLQRLGRALQLRLELPASPVVIHGDGARLQRALLDLGLNAAQAMPAGGELLLRLELEDHSALIEVRDRGEGIGERALRERGYSSKADGSGLGLLNVAATVAEHGGRLELVRQQDGTAARLYLPLAGGES